MLSPAEPLPLALLSSLCSLLCPWVLPPLSVMSLPRRMAWMNGVAVGRAAYQPTSVEHWANMVTHGVSTVFLCVALPLSPSFCYCHIPSLFPLLPPSLPLKYDRLTLMLLVPLPHSYPSIIPSLSSVWNCRRNLPHSTSSWCTVLIIHCSTLILLMKVICWYSLIYLARN